MNGLNQPKFPSELPERKALYQAVLDLQALVYEPTEKRLNLWQPADVLPPTDEPCPSLTAGGLVTKVTFESPLSKYNLRLADIACAVANMKGYLTIAGLSQDDSNLWDQHQKQSNEIRKNPKVPPSTSENVYVRADGYRGIYSEPESWSRENECRERMPRADAQSANAD